jgi:hypothetical protein
MSNPNEVTDTVGTSRDLLLVHAEVLANKDGAPNPLRSWDNTFELAISSSQAMVRKTDQNTS